MHLLFITYHIVGKSTHRLLMRLLGAKAFEWRHMPRHDVSNHQHHVFWTVNLCLHYKNHQRPHHRLVVRVINQWLVDYPHKGPVSRKTFPCEYVIMDGPIFLSSNCDILQGFIQEIWRRVYHKLKLTSLSLSYTQHNIKTHILSAIL